MKLNKKMQKELDRQNAIANEHSRAVMKGKINQLPLDTEDCFVIENPANKIEKELNRTMAQKLESRESNRFPDDNAAVNILEMPDDNESVEIVKAFHKLPEDGFHYIKLFDKGEWKQTRSGKIGRTLQFIDVELNNVWTKFVFANAADGQSLTQMFAKISDENNGCFGGSGTANERFAYLTTNKIPVWTLRTNESSVFTFFNERDFKYYLNKRDSNKADIEAKAESKSIEADTSIDTDVPWKV